MVLGVGDPRGPNVEPLMDAGAAVDIRRGGLCALAFCWPCL